ncbi:bifunctional diguanylate cyclase/phosphodiesterase [uncultured Pseudokineococcus sp.]|uniref:putative bifunctional diguanylate cyclase/phosphodiesterase n=1 Tax=uncultured Pseudokineococcus sp. TaxID=1642928 RepID=UPI002617FA61|nr:bifunctional diguanylate cyclase/phosphodiesterase [uncultured Pseudokineococcus sp.]
MREGAAPADEQGMDLEALRRPRLAWAALGVLLLVALATALLPALRPVTAHVVPWASVVGVLVGVALHRPAGWWGWLLMAAMLATWSANHVLEVVGLEGPAHVLLLSGQVLAAVVLLLVAHRSGGPRRRVDVLELFVVCAVLGLVAAQTAVLLASSSSSSRLGLVATVDVVLLAFVLRSAVVRRRSSAAWWLAVAAATALAFYDISTVGRLFGDSYGAASTPAVVLGFGLFGVAALHPSMRIAFEPRELAEGRPRSTDVLGLLPLVVVPVGLRLVDLAVGGASLPGWTHLVVGTSTALAGVLRSWSALRGAEHLAEHDPLTDLPNRRGLARVHDDQAEGGWALLLVDLDDFKDVNDAHGHDVGDRLLLGVRDRLRAAVGEDGVVARFGGDEFAVLVHPGLEDDVAERVVVSLRTPMEVGDLVLRTSASVGVAAPAPGTPLSEQLTRADVALYAAKGAGRDTARSYRPEQRDEVMHRFTLTSQVRLLLAGRSPSVGRLEMHYQPLVELATGEVVGAEALVRWRHPEHGLLAPDAFLGHVTASGLDADLDGAVLAEVLEQLGRWRDQRRRVLPVSVNLSRSSLLDPGLPERVREALARAGVPGSQLHVEILEHEPLPEDDQLLEVLHDLRGLGVGIHLDDYGRGYTSLDYLQRFPVQVLKIDRSVVTGASPGRSRLVAGIVAMSRTLRLDLLAEGVETEEQRRHLLAQGVRLGQGWLFSRALPATEYAEQVLGPRPDLPPVADVPAPRLPLRLGADLPS